MGVGRGKFLYAGGTMGMMMGMMMEYSKQQSQSRFRTRLLVDLGTAAATPLQKMGESSYSSVDFLGEHKGMDKCGNKNNHKVHVSASRIKTRTKIPFP